MAPPPTIYSDITRFLFLCVTFQHHLLLCIEGFKRGRPFLPYPLCGADEGAWFL